MKNYLSLLIPFILLASCDNKAPKEFADIYENLSARYLYIYADKDFYIQNDAPIVLSYDAVDTFFDTLKYVPITYIANSDTLTSNIFAPTTKGKYTIRGVMPNGVISNVLRVEVFDESDVERLELKHNGVNYLTTNEWSISSDFRQFVVIAGKSFEITQNDDIALLKDGVDAGKKGEFSFNQAGEYNFSFKLGNRTSNTETLYVREKQEFDYVELPVVFHFVNADNYKGEVSSVLTEVNRLYSNTGINQNDVLRNGDNPNKVNTYLKFTLANSAPSGQSLDGSGIHVIQSGNGTVEYSRVSELARQNYWDPNKYINIYVGSGSWGIGGDANSATLLKEELLGAPTVDTEPANPFFNRVFLNAIGGGMSAGTIAHELGHLLSLHHNFAQGCALEGDFVTDTYAYIRSNQGATPVTEDCFGQPFSQDNLMDYFGNERVFTYGQRERLRLMIEHALFIPTPKNLLKGKKKAIDGRKLKMTNMPIE